MNYSSDIKRLIKGVFVGGLFAVVSLFALVYFFALMSQPKVEYLKLFCTLAVLFIASTLAVWGAGFWGRWGMILFFIIAPVILILDFSLNPLFPLGIIVFAAACYKAKLALNTNA